MQLWNHFACDISCLLEDLVRLAEEGYDLIGLLRDCRGRHPDATWRLKSAFFENQHEWPTEREQTRSATGARVLVELVGVRGPRPLAHGFHTGGSPTDEARRAMLHAIADALNMKANHDVQEAKTPRPGECDCDLIVEEDPRFI